MAPVGEEGKAIGHADAAVRIKVSPPLSEGAASIEEVGEAGSLPLLFVSLRQRFETATMTHRDPASSEMSVVFGVSRPPLWSENRPVWG